MAEAWVSQIRPVEDLGGPAGRLEAVLNTGRDDARCAALVCHPHPLGGGTMHTKAVYHAMKAFAAFGLPVLRFNFRGVGLSEGEHAHGRGEQDDVRAAVEWLEERFDGRAILLAGFSFGAYVGLRVGCGDVRVKGLVALGLPVRAAGREYGYGFLARCVAPKLFISGDRDEFAPREELTAVWESAAEPKRLVWIEGADHFFQAAGGGAGSKLLRMQTEMRAWIGETFGLEEIATPG
jgi:alpha/beta superfamily hydrolase